MFGLIGTFVNVICCVAGSLVGMLIGNKIPDTIKTTLMKGIGITTLVIGFNMALKTTNELIIVISIVIGGFIGELLHLDVHLNHLGDNLKSLFKVKDDRFLSAFISASMLWCVGAMTFVGSIQAGLVGDCSILYTKSIMDMISATILASTMGIGVLFASLVVLVMEGSITLLAFFLQNVLVDAAITQISVVGGALIIALGINILEIKEMPVVNLLPALIVGAVFGSLGIL